MATTTIHALPIPDQLPAGTGPDVPKDIKNLGDAVDSKLTPFSQGLLDDRPAYGKVGQRYRDENGIEYLDIGSAWVVSGSVQDGSITTAKIADGAVTTPKFADLGVTTGKINDGAVTSAKINDKAITAAKVADALKPSTGAASGAEAFRALGTAAGQAAPGTHGSQHARSGADPIPFDTYSLVGNYADRPDPATLPNGLRFWARDKAAEFVTYSGVWELMHQIAPPTVTALPSAGNSFVGERLYLSKAKSGSYVLDSGSPFLVLLEYRPSDTPNALYPWKAVTAPVAPNKAEMWYPTAVGVTANTHPNYYDPGTGNILTPFKGIYNFTYAYYNYSLPAGALYGAPVIDGALDASKSMSLGAAQQAMSGTWQVTLATLNSNNSARYMVAGGNNLQKWNENIVLNPLWLGA